MGAVGDFIGDVAGGIGDVFNTVTGGLLGTDPSKPGATPLENQAGLGALYGLANQLGAIQQNAGGSPTFDWSNIGKPISVAEANRGYDYSPLQEAMAGFANPAKFNQTYSPTSYNPSTFNFGTLPTQYTNNAIQMGSKDINRQGANDLARIQQAVGTRRPGLLLKAAQQNQRNVGENLANLATNLRGQEMLKNTDLGVEQQKAQEAANQFGANFNAGENYKGYQSKSDLEKNNEENRIKNLQSLADTGNKNISLRQGITKDERDQQNQALDRLTNFYRGIYATRSGITDPGTTGLLPRIGNAVKSFI